MKTVRLVRSETGPEGTFGHVVVLSADGAPLFACRSLELPWRANCKAVSCIPPDSYPLNWRESPRHGHCFHVDEVKGRTDVEVHSANLAGDEKHGFAHQLLGCIALGEDVQTFKAGARIGNDVLGRDQRGVTASKMTITAFEKALGGESALLVVEWAPGVLPMEEA